MLDNFEETKKQLNELSAVLNKFKSEAVQLKLVELLFKEASLTVEETSVPNPQKPRRKTSKRKQRVKDTQAEQKKPVKRASGQGAVATLGKLVDEQFFKTPKTIGDIVEHCDHNLARKFKANEFSGKLGRLVRDGSLARTKNAESQYEYKNK